MSRHIVTDPKGLVIGTKAAGDGTTHRVPQLLKKGDVVPANITGSQLAAWKHFRQVEVIKDNPQSKPPDHGKSWAK